MAEIPASWGLKKARKNGKTQLIGKDDAGKDYVARTCDGDVTESDVKEMAEFCDRTRSTPEKLRGKILGDVAANQQRFEQQMEQDFMEPAEQVAFAGLHKGARTLGYGRRYAHNFEKVVWS